MEKTVLSAKALAAVEALKAGAQFAKRLERSAYTGREQFAHRLLKGGQALKGYGVATFYELQGAGLLVTASSYTTATYYKLREEA